MTPTLEGRVAIVTGAGRGIGRAYALELAQAGCHVVVNDFGEGVADEVVKEIRAAGGTAIGDRHDIVENAEAIVAAAVDAFGRLDIIINNAGVLSTTSFCDTPKDVWKRVLDVHLMGTVNMCRAGWPHLLASDAGRIVNVASGAMAGNAGFTAYGAAKGAIFAFSRSLALEADETSITVNCIFPFARTRMADDLPEPLRETLDAHFHPQHIASFVAWLAHPSTRINNGAFEVGGGNASRVQLAIGDAVTASPISIAGWAAQETALLATGPLAPLHTASDIFGLEVARVMGSVQDADTETHSIAFGKVELQ